MVQGKGTNETHPEIGKKKERINCNRIHEYSIISIKGNIQK
jgi:hypothetical protein